MSKKTRASKADRVKVCRFMTDFSQLLGLPRCWIEILEDPSPKGTYAHVEHNDQRYHALVRLCGHWRELSELDRFNTAVHETLHLTHRRLITAALNETIPLLHDWEWENLNRNVKRETELWVDQMALAWCQIAEVRTLWYGNANAS